jgi:hypothetical protein
LTKKNSGSGGKPGKASKANTLGMSAQTTISNYYATTSWVSMATSMVAGTSALMLEQNLSWIPNWAKTRLMIIVVSLKITLMCW